MNREYRLARLDVAREQAYVTALERMTSGQQVVGTLGPVPTDLVWAAGAWPIPVLSQDDSTRSFCQESALCNPITATIGYAASGKCPLLYAANPILVHAGCSHRLQITKYLPEKTVLLYREGDISWEAQLEEALGVHPDPAAREQVKRQTEEMRKLQETLLRYVQTKQLPLKDWVTLTNGIRFLSDRSEQQEMLSFFCEESAGKKRADTYQSLTISTLYGVDPALLDLLDAAPCGYALQFVGCEERENLVGNGLSLTMTNCIRVNTETISLQLGQIGAETRARLKNTVDKGEENDRR